MDREPGCLQLSLTRKLMPTCAYLMEDLNLSQQQLRTLVSKVSVSPICVCVWYYTHTHEHAHTQTRTHTYMYTDTDTGGERAEN
jgi:hypothetical protein